MSVAVDLSRHVPDLEGMRFTQVEHWVAQCDSFRGWYKENFRLRRPGRDQEELADKALPWMIRFTRALISQLSDPQLPNAALVRLLESTLWQLEEDWAARQDGMSDAEADRVLQSVFPKIPSNAS